MAKLLILGGTSEAAALARQATNLPGLEVITSLAGATRQPAPLPGSVRIGGFGGVDGMTDALATHRIDLVVDATHPFAETISAHAVAACERLSLHRLAIWRPPWVSQPEDRWLPVADVEDAADAVNRLALPQGQAVLLTIGRRDLAPFARCPGIGFVVRSVDPPDAPPPLARHVVITARGPFTEADETRLFDEHGIAALVTRNSGGAAAAAKLAAARQRRVPVIMIERPVPPPPPLVGDVDAACAWICRTLAIAG